MFACCGSRVCRASRIAPAWSGCGPGSRSRCGHDATSAGPATAATATSAKVNVGVAKSTGRTTWSVAGLVTLIGVTFPVTWSDDVCPLICRATSLGSVFCCCRVQKRRCLLMNVVIVCPSFLYPLTCLDLVICFETFPDVPALLQETVTISQANQPAHTYTK